MLFFNFIFIVTIEQRISLVCKLRLGLSGTIVSFDVEKRAQGIRVSEIHPSFALRMAIQRVGSVMFLILSTVQQVVA
jgi:ABC-type thiamin/hydroxymethylpyrimidine transport system permease subunit